MSAKEMFNSGSENSSNAEERAYAREDLIFNTTEDLLLMIEDLNLTKVELAKRLGKSKSYVTQVLSGSRNMTLGSFSDICFALGFKPEIKIPVKESTSNGNGWAKAEAKTVVTTKLETSRKIYLAHDESWANCKVA
ncbi:hypothetical protein A9Q82_01530 [Cycloclasticus sp. 46_120_T64]|nr:hypothetical protein A9Q82_01530 [Cycloclasticus sp. 46_120_T64]